MKQFINNIISEPPSLFKKIRNIGIIAGLLGGFVATLPATLPMIAVPATILAIGQYMAGIGTVTALIGQLPKKIEKAINEADQDQLDQK